MRNPFTIIIVALLVLVLSCDDCKQASDENPYCTDFNFRILSSKTGNDLLFGPNATIAHKRDLLICVNTSINGKICSDIFGGPVVSQKKIDNQDVLTGSICMSTTAGYWSNLQIEILDTIVYRVDYKLLDSEGFCSLSPAEYYFVELYLNDILQCSPCHPNHIATLSLDI